MEADTQAGKDIQRLIEPLYRGKFWMQLVGVMLIISGVLTALSIVGILICWIPIWAGISLMQAAGSIDQAYITGDDAVAELAMRRLKTYFTIFGVLTLIYIVIGVLGMLFGLGAGMMGGGHGMGAY
ncbi:DUF5362 family protein [Halofilum ochraceum]|uniref:DUF5362 family protein n=1 Tax=Halofilum ochraceum TaxID=1611323 RepID=UPI0008339AB3|nr:DUF5362 family protein [Halofilum ochraceum]